MRCSDLRDLFQTVILVQKSTQLRLRRGELPEACVIVGTGDRRMVRGLYVVYVKFEGILVRRASVQQLRMPGRGSIELR
jgi:hypothetical protein